MRKVENTFNTIPRSNNTTSHKYPGNVNINVRNDNQINSTTWNTLTKRPIPTPRRTQSTRQNAIETNQEISSKQMSPNMFYDASNTGPTKNHLKGLEMTLTEMHLKGFIKKENLQRDNSNSTSEESNILISKAARDVNNLDFDHLPPKVNPSIFNIITPDTKQIAHASGGYSTTNIDDGALYSIVDNSAVVYNDYNELPGAFKDHLEESADMPDLSRSLANTIDHLKTTEKEYLQELIEVIPVYTYGIKHHTSSKIKDSADAICATVESLLDTQMQFEKDLSEAVSVEEVVNQFANHGHIFRIYKQFFKGSGSKITFTIGDTQTDFEKEISLRMILRHRLISYNTFFEEIEHPSNRSFVESFQTIITAALNSDSSPCVESCPFEISDIYLLKDTFNVSGQFKKASEQFNSTAFLYSNFILLTVEHPADTFYYKAHINMNEISPMPEGKKKKVLKIKDFVKTKHHGHDIIYKLEAASEAILEKWRNKIQKLLEAQNMEHKAAVKLRHISRHTS